ncbi:uncharacterized protein LOC142173622 [Nicotiana tabacum]|uniref:Uncharacterized protein LOC142173622 n=1 Tax=Nicotiana tabacum TaxID=4097 RepID=A0AC58TDN8_TOBAC
MKDDESIQDMHTRFTSIINELHSLGETIPRNKLVRKILTVLPSSWESKVNAITEAKDLHTLTIYELVDNLKTYEIKKKKENERREPKREKNLVLKTDNNDSSGEDSDMAYLTRRFHKMVRSNGGIPKRGSSSKPKNMTSVINVPKRNPVPDKCFKRKNAADNVVKKALAAWGESSSESEKENDHGDSSMMAVESEATEYDSIFSLMDHLLNDKDTLTVELREAEQTRDDLVIIVVDLKETIENLKKEKDALDEKIAHIEHERDDLMVAVVDLKETFECVRKEKEVLAERVANIEHERDDLLVVVVDLKETIGEPKIESRLENSQKGKEGTVKGSSLQCLLSVFQICDKGNKVEFVSKICTVTNIVTGEVVLVAKGYKNIYVADLESLQNGDLNCLSAIDDDAELWHRRSGHASFTLLNKLVRKDLVHGLPKSSFKDHKVTKDETFEVFVAFVKRIQVKMGNNVACIRRVDQDGEPLFILGEVIDMENGKADMMSHVKESIQGTPLAEVRSSQEPQSDIPGSSTKEIQVPNWKHKSSHPLDNIITPLDSSVQTRSKARNSLAFSAFLSQIEPKNFKEALKDADWITAIQEELHQFERNKEEGIDYDETFAPVARMEVIRILIAFASHIEFTLFQMDVKSAFLNGYLKEEVYVKQPPGFESHEYPEHVFKLDNALYGLKQAPRA